MDGKKRTYLAIDLKSFYASVECVDRHLDPLTTNLVVADASRTEKTICLAVSPSLKAYKIPGRARLFEAVQRVREVNAQRLQTAIRQKKAVRGEEGKYHFASTSFDANALNADPALGLSYIVAPPRMQRYLDVSTQIYKTYLKYVSPTDYHNEELLYKLFGVNAELLIDHAWGWEPCTIADIKAYKPENKSIVSGQILQYPYPFEKARLVIQEMADALALELVDKRLATNQLVLTVGYDIENLKGTAYTGEITTDHYGRKIPKHAHGTVNLDGYTSSGEELLKAATSLYDRIVDKTLLARRLTLCANHLLDESSVPEDLPEQIDLFTDYSAKEKQKKEADTAHARERKLQKTMLGIKKRFGKNAILKGLNLEDGATARERNNQIGGHKA